MRDLFHQAKKLYTVFSGLQPEGGLKEFENWKLAEFSMKIHLNQTQYGTAFAQFVVTRRRY